MPQNQIDELHQELFYLYSELGAFFRNYDASEYAFCEGLAEYDELATELTVQFSRVRTRIKAVSIDWGIQGEFLDEFLAQANQKGLRLVA